MSSAQLEIFLARLYTEPALRERFLAAPDAVAREAGLSVQETSALAAIDRTGLQMAAASFARKRAAHAGRRGLVSSIWRWIGRRF